MENPLTASAQLLSLTDVAAWQLPSVIKSTPKIIAALPAMQRGAVWKPAQTESLWDSLARGFPIGAFLLTPFVAERGINNFALNEPGSGHDASHHLLDGQQRATAIALGFLNPWNPDEPDTRAVLWVDLAPPPENSDQAFIFRVVTRSHPWGYKRTDPKSPIPINQIHQALTAYRAAIPDLVDKNPSEIPLAKVWPWDAEAPIPVSMLIDAIRSDGDTIAMLQEKLATLPFWKTKARVSDALNKKESDLAKRLQRLIEGLRYILVGNSYGIPVLMLPHTARPVFLNEMAGEKQDPVEILFIRVNQAGTRLEGEELIYSILKSIWPEAPCLIESLRHKLVTPPRLVLLAARLVLAESSVESAPVTPNIARFRRLINGMDSNYPEFKKQLQDFIKNKDRAARIFETAKRLLTEGSWALPPVLAADIARNAPDIIFLFLCWIDRMLVNKKNPCDLDEMAKRRMLGMLTALAWFAADHSQSLNALWQPLQKCAPEDLPNFFAQPQFKRTLILGQRDSLRMLPLPPPETLKQVLDDCVLSPNGAYDDFENPEHEFWRDWNRWTWMSGRLTDDLKKWYSSHQGDLWQRKASADEEPFDLDGKYLAAWTGFINKLWDEKRLLLYIQSQWLIKWFPDYDPTLPEQIEDMNRPWDFDHIHPKKYIESVNNIPRIIKDWHKSIGNFRAWPLELNRMDQYDSPKKKLSKVDKPEKRYSISQEDELLLASFIDKDVDWPLWKETVPNGETCFPHQYLAKPKDYGPYRLKLIQAITTRFIAIYRHWYEQLHIKDLMNELKHLPHP